MGFTGTAVAGDLLAEDVGATALASWAGGEVAGGALVGDIAAGGASLPGETRLLAARFQRLRQAEDLLDLREHQRLALLQAALT